MKFKRPFNENDINKLKNNGVLILPNFIQKNILNVINKEIKSWTNKITFNNNYSSSIIGNNQWIAHLGLCSKKALEIALDLNLIRFLENYFNKKVILAECAYQKKILPEKNPIKWHGDRENGIYIFVYLTPIEQNTGATKFIEKSHLIPYDNGKKYKIGDGANYIDNLSIKKNINNMIQAYGGPGTIVIFNQNIWHKLPAFNKSGREVLWFKYFSKDMNKYAVDHLYKQSILSTLNNEQLDVYCINNSSNLKKGMTQLGSNKFEAGEHKINDFRMFFYFIRYKILSFFKIK